MRETRADTTRALVYAIALHVLLFAVAFIGLWWTRSSAPAAAAGPVIEAELIDPDALSASTRRALRQRPAAVAPTPPPAAPVVEEEAAPPPQPEPEPLPEQAPTPPQPQAQEPVPEPDTRDVERTSAQALADQVARQRAEELRRRQEQIDLTEKQRQEDAERREKLSEMERQRLDQLAEVRRQRQQAAREAQLAEQKLKQLADARARNASEDAAQADADASASPPPGSGGVDESLKAQYAQAIADAIRRNWTRPENVPLDAPCRLEIRQIRGGEVIDVQVSPSCPYDELGRRSVEAAVLKAAPLPYQGFEAVFSRELTLYFRARD